MPPQDRPPDRGPTLIDADAHSEAFRYTRASLRAALMEDYVELIDDLLRSGREPRQVEIAARLGVAQPTVAKMLARLTAEGLVGRNRARGVFLTERGRKVAADARARHVVVETFLRALGVSAETARLDAEGIEHHVSDETLRAFEAFIRREGGT